MPQGFQAFNANGTIFMDSDDATGGCIADTVFTSGAAFTLSYPAFAGRTATPFFMSGVAAGYPTVSYGPGYPQISFLSYAGGGIGLWMIAMS